MARKELNSVEYLEYVLTEWKAFVKSHQLLANHIESILKENKELKEELSKKDTQIRMIKVSTQNNI